MLLNHDERAADLYGSDNALENNAYGSSPSLSVFRQAATPGTDAERWEARTSQDGHNSFSHSQQAQEVSNRAPRRTHSMDTAHDHQHHQHRNPNKQHDNNKNEKDDENNDGVHDYSDRGVGARPLGFQAVARVRKLERKERSTRRFLLSQQSSKSLLQGISNELAPLKRASVASVATTISSDQPDVFYQSSDCRMSPADQGMFESHKATTSQVLKNIIFGKTVSVLLLLMPVALWANHRGWSATWKFWLNFAVLVPLATILSDFTEEVAAHTNQTLGGLINATFGNAVEVLVGIQALLADEIRVVQASMLGSIFSNLLLVLGSCFFFGGLFYKEQRFNSTAATANMGLLALSSIALVLPTPFAEYYKIQDEHVLTISRVAAIFLMFMYLQLLVFQLKTHAHLFQDDADDNDPASIPMWVALSGLLIATLLITLFSEFLVQSIDGFCRSSGISRTFVGLIILPFVGNAVEHVAAVTVAMKDKMDLAMGGKKFHGW